MLDEIIPTAPVEGTPSGSPPEAPAPEPQPKEEKVSPGFEALARREREFVRRQQEAKQREQQITEREAKAKELEAKFSKKLSPIEALQAHGYTYEEATQFILNDSKPTPELEVKSVRDEMKKLREEYENEQKTLREQQQKDFQERQSAQVEQFKSDLSDYLDEHSETYELVSLQGDEGRDLVYDLIRTDWEQKLQKYESSGRIGRPPKIMSTETACKLAEEELESRVEETFTKSKKLQSRYSKAQAQTEAAVEPSPSMEMPKTLNNALISPSAPQYVSAQTDQERMERALKALEGK